MTLSAADAAPVGLSTSIILTAEDQGGRVGSRSFVLTVTELFVSAAEKLTASDAADEDLFGSAVAIDGSFAIVGAPRDDDDGANSGSAYVFRHGSGWVLQSKLPPSAPVFQAAALSAGDNFGDSVAISGAYAFVGAPRDSEHGTGAGGVYVYERCDPTFELCDQAWFEVGKLTASDAADNDNFGYSVAIDGDHAIVGAQSDDLTGLNEGSAYVFKRNGDTWVEIDQLIASDAADYDNFGFSVAIDGDYAIIGARLDDLTGTNEGSAYIFKK